MCNKKFNTEVSRASSSILLLLLNKRDMMDVAVLINFLIQSLMPDLRNSGKLSGVYTSMNRVVWKIEMYLQVISNQSQR